MMSSAVLASAEYRPATTLPEPESEGTIAERARELPEVDDIGWSLTQATAWREGTPALAHTLATATAETTGVNAASLRSFANEPREATRNSSPLSADRSRAGL